LDEQEKDKRNEEKVIRELLDSDSCDSIGISKYDVLIFYAWSFPSRENYIRYWNIIKNNSPPKQ